MYFYIFQFLLFYYFKNYRFENENNLFILCDEYGAKCMLEFGITNLVDFICLIRCFCTIS